MKEHREHIVRTSRFELPLTPREAFRFFTPEGERLWAKGWDPCYVHPIDGTLRDGMVFTTGHGAEETVWMVLRHEPEAARVEYLRMTPGSRVGFVRVGCDAVDGGCRVTVTYELTALTASGDEYLRGIDPAAYEAYIGTWASSIREQVVGRVESVT